MKKIRTSILAAVLSALALPFAWAHPAVEGGLKHGFAAVPGLYGSHIELAVDAKAGQIRIYISEAQDEKLPDGKNYEWVIPMAVRSGTAGALLPMRDPGAGKEWFPVAPAETKDGWVFYRIEAAARVMLDGDASRRSTLAFAPAADARGTACLAASIDLSKARTLRLEEVKVSILDAAGAKPAWEKACFTGGWGLGKIMKNLEKTDLPLQVFADALAKAKDMERFRKPPLPAR